MVASPEILVFSDFRLDLRGGGLYRRDESGAYIPVAIGSRALDVLAVLAARPGELVSKDEIVAAVWPQTLVEDSNLTVQISTLRRVLDGEHTQASLIQTVAGRGYRLTARVSPGAIAGASAASGEPRVRAGWLRRVPATRRLTLLRAWSVAIASASLAVALLSWWLWPTKPSPVPAPAPTAAATAAPLQAVTAPRMSIVVLPFTNLSNDPERQYFADAMTEDLTTDLSRIWDMFVIAPRTAFTYRDKPADAKRIGHELGVRYVLEGSVQEAGNQVRINAQLIDAETDGHLWAERFERAANDLFALQNEITTRIAVALRKELISAEAARRSEGPDVEDYILRALAISAVPPSREALAEGMRLLERALALDPQSVAAQSYVAAALAGRVLSNTTATPAADLERAGRLSEHALSASPNLPLVHFARAQVLRAQRRYAEAIPELEAVLTGDRNMVYAYFALGQCKFMTGAVDEAIPLIERAIRLSPRDPQLGVWHEQIGNVNLFLGHADSAILWLEKARALNPSHSMIHADLAAAYGFAGQTERAAAELAEARRLSPTDRYSSLARLRSVMNYGVPKIRAMREATYFVGMRKAGMSEE